MGLSAASLQGVPLITVTAADQPKAARKESAATGESARRFSVVITCHNQRDFIRDAVDSALSQTAIPTEIIVVDDASGDDSANILKSYGDAITLHVFPQNRGPLHARNHGASVARGQFIVFLDGDDALRPFALAAYDRLIEERAPAVILAEKIWCQNIVPTAADRDHPSTLEIAEYPTLFAKDRSAGMSASTFVIDRQVFFEVGGWSPDIFQLDCYDLCTNVGVAGRTILLVEPRTAYYRIHSTNSISAVAPFIHNAHRILDKEAAGLYPGGRAHRYGRRAWLGGMLFFWTQRAFRAGLVRDALTLAARGSLMMAIGAFRKAALLAKGRPPLRTLPLARDAPHPVVHVSAQAVSGCDIKVG
jgi:glycosyltransferase involved in cell wall biosynthesis